MHSCLYEGRIAHQRLKPTSHAFRYGLYLAYLDLDEIPSLLKGGFGLYQARFSPASYCRSDHLGNCELPLSDAVRNLVDARTGWRPTGPIRLLTPLRNWGYYFSPLSLYYCFDPAGKIVEAVVAEVSNTPWLERHCYVLWSGNRVGNVSSPRFRHAKSFHVSPFMDMEMDYFWHLNPPGKRINVKISSFRGNERLFDACLVLKRRQLNRMSLLGTLARFPWMTGRMVQAIYWQALLLWRKRLTYYPHP
ncbi:MAG: DUF1365 domain-containing protein [Planctomycetota bacterium]